MRATRQCPFRGCRCRIDSRFFACGPHWYALSEAHKRRIFAAYDAWRKGHIDGLELRRRQGDVLREHEGAAGGGGA